jgi:hypothetical protein
VEKGAIEGLVVLGLLYERYFVDMDAVLLE